MHRCFVPPSCWSGARLSLPADERHHVRQVLRMHVGDEVVAFDGEGREGVARLVETGEGWGLELLHECEDRHERVRIVLIQAIPKGKRMELLVEKATELGVGTIIPMVTERTVVRLDGRQVQAKQERWARIATSAAKQCGTRWMPEILPVAASLQAALAAVGPLDLLLAGIIRPDSRPLKDVILEHPTVRSVGVVIGPEGDLTEGEIATVLAAGATPVGFGGQVLRVETAAIFAVSVIGHLYGI
jgi:16S rRNA (uracil1498-N3)-methyltransferase